MVQSSGGSPAQEGAAVSLDFIAEHRQAERWEEAPHSHQCCEAVLVQAGRLRLVCEGSEAALHKGALAVVSPHTTHALLGDTPGDTAYVHLGLKGLDFVAPAPDERFGVFGPEADHRGLAAVLRLLLEEQRRREAHYQPLCQRLCEAAALMLLRLDGTGAVAPGSPGRGGRESAFVKRYIDEHFTETLTLDMLAGLAHINKFYLVHSFTAEYGISPINYLVRRRIEESRYYLENTSQSISQISQQLGFSSPGYFSQRFSAYMKLSPRAYRERARRGMAGADV